MTDATNVAEVESKGNGSEHVYRLYADDANELVVGATQAIGRVGGELRDLRIVKPSLEGRVYSPDRKEPTLI